MADDEKIVQALATSIIGMMKEHIKDEHSMVEVQRALRAISQARRYFDHHQKTPTSQKWHIPLASPIRIEKKPRSNA